MFVLINKIERIIMNYEQLISEKKLIEITGFCRATLYNWRVKGKIPYYKVGRAYRYILSEVLEAIKGNA